MTGGSQLVVDDAGVAVRVEVARASATVRVVHGAVVAAEEARVGDGEPADVGRAHAPAVGVGRGRAARSGRPSRRRATRTRSPARCATWSSCWRARCQTSHAMWFASASGRQSSSSTESPSTTSGTPSRMRPKPSSSRSRGGVGRHVVHLPSMHPSRAAPTGTAVRPAPAATAGRSGPFAADVSERAPPVSEQPRPPRTPATPRTDHDTGDDA